MRRLIPGLGLSAILVVACAQMTDDSTQSGQLDAPGFQAQMSDKSLFGGHASEPKKAVSLTPLHERAVVIGTGGTAPGTTTTTGTTTGTTTTTGSLTPTSGFDNELSYFLTFANWIFGYNDSVTTVGLIYFGDTNYYPPGYLYPGGFVPQDPNATVVPTQPGCTHYLISLNSNSQLARLRINLNGGSHATWIRSPDARGITLDYDNYGGAQGEFTFAMLGSPGYSRSLSIAVSTSVCVSATGATPTYVAGGVNQDVSSYINGYDNNTSPYWSQQVGTSLVEGRFVSRPYYQGCNNGFYSVCSNNYGVGYGYSPTWVQQ